jgi:hypothetical protein
MPAGRQRVAGSPGRVAGGRARAPSAWWCRTRPSRGNTRFSGRQSGLVVEEDLARPTGPDPRRRAAGKDPPQSWWAGPASVPPPRSGRASAGGAEQRPPDDPAGPELAQADLPPAAGAGGDPRPRAQTDPVPLGVAGAERCSGQWTSSASGGRAAGIPGDGAVVGGCNRWDGSRRWPRRGLTRTRASRPLSGARGHCPGRAGTARGAPAGCRGRADADQPWTPPPSARRWDLRHHAASVRSPAPVLVLGETRWVGWWRGRCTSAARARSGGQLRGHAGDVGRLFGHEKAVSPAPTAPARAVQQASGGTVFLDGSAASAPAQALLRAGGRADAAGLTRGGGGRPVVAATTRTWSDDRRGTFRRTCSTGSTP